MINRQFEHVYVGLDRGEVSRVSRLLSKYRTKLQASEHTEMAISCNDTLILFKKIRGRIFTCLGMESLEYIMSICDLDESKDPVDFIHKHMQTRRMAFRAAAVGQFASRIVWFDRKHYDQLGRFKVMDKPYITDISIREWERPGADRCHAVLIKDEGVYMAALLHYIDVHDTPCLNASIQSCMELVIEDKKVIDIVATGRQMLLQHCLFHVTDYISHPDIGCFTVQEEGLIIDPQWSRLTSIYSMGQKDRLKRRNL